MALSPKDCYLVLYNLCCCVGWASVLSMGFQKLLVDGVSKASLASIYSEPGLATLLTVVQSAAMLEIVHAAIGFVRSPVFITTLQVGSRIAALFAIVNSPEAGAQFGAGFMILSWALVEVPRYAFYMSALITGDATKKTPYPLFWLRYSLFAILYPTGIFGELTVFLSASKDTAFLNLFGEQYATLMYYFIMSFPVIYAPGALPMIFNMAGNRKKAMKKRFARAPPPPRGLVFPVDEKRGDRGSTPVAKAILAAAVGAVAPEKAEKLLKERNWRFGYVKHFTGMVEEQMKSEKNALAVAQAGLKKAYEIFEFVSADGKITTSFGEAMSKNGGDKFFTGFVKGEAAPSKNVLEVPYKGTKLSGQSLKDQVDKWVSYGTIEASAGEAIKNCVDKPGYLDLSDRYFVLLGAGSAMGPFLVLMALGANVIAVDLDRAGIWKRLVSIAKGSSGSITFPMKVEQSSCKTDDEFYAACGCNLFTETPRIRDWVMDLYPGKSLTVGSYAYLNGALHVQVSLAMDAICKDLSEKRKASLAYLCTPTDLHIITKEAHEASKKEYKTYSKKIYCILMKLLGRGKFLKKNAMKPFAGEGGEFYAVNGLSVAQGPNYALAKRMQHWRAVIARNQGSIVSSNIAPATSTVSVVQNRTFAWAYEGMPYFKPYEIFAPETSNSVMSAILFSDLNDPDNASNPKNKLNNPNELFKYGSFNGGAWRCAYTVDTIGEASVFLYFGRVAKPYVSAIIVVGSAIGLKLAGVV
jgi:hypothetical protein